MDKQVREAVQMVLTRMETHPEDFYNDGRLHNYNTSRFGWVWNVVTAEAGYSYGLNKAEITALKKGYDALMYRKFHDKVLESLLNEPEQEEKMVRQGSSLKSPKFVLSQSQVNTARTLGISLEDYALHVDQFSKVTNSATIDPRTILGNGSK